MSEIGIIIAILCGVLAINSFWMYVLFTILDKEFEKLRKAVEERE